jgi:PAS domain S-box-containing protein
MTPEDILRSTIQVCPFGVVVVEPSGVIVLANRELELMFGYAHDELVGQAVDILIPKRQRQQHAKHISHFETYPQVRMANNRKVSGVRKDGTELLVEVGHNSFPTRTGTRTICVAVDISERVRMESLRTEFIATVSHELRTPLTSISGALGLIASYTAEKLPGPVTRLLSIANSNCLKLVQLVNHILNIENIETNEFVSNLTRVDIQSLVKHAIESNLAFAETHSVSVRLECSATYNEILTDPDWIDQVVGNLLSNAVKFSPPDGEVVVKIESRSRSVRISVRDHGHGVPEDFKLRLFERFAQADVRDAREKGGWGLGLSIVKLIVMRLGGEVGFNDAAGGGAIFYFDLPDGEIESVMAKIADNGQSLKYSYHNLMSACGT